LQVEAVRPPRIAPVGALKSPLPTVAVAVCTRNRPDDLNACLDLISRLDPHPDEILVIDNSDGDRVTEGIAREHGARYIVERNPGLSHARNRALLESTSEIVAYLDDDAVPAVDWLEQLLAPFADPRVASASGPIAAAGAGRDPSPAPTRTVDNQDARWFEMVTSGGMTRGSNMALRKSLCSVWRGFDARLGRGAPLPIAEESHAVASLLVLGFRTAYVPAAVIYHPVKPRNARQVAEYAFAYWLFLLGEFPGRRLDLIRFLARRLRGKRISWPRDPHDPGQIASSGWGLRIKAALAGSFLYLRLRNGPPLSANSSAGLAAPVSHGRDHRAPAGRPASPAVSACEP
jgi:glycosyltransferase involved in cell wall biosynthesis